MSNLSYSNFENQSRIKKMLINQHLEEGFAEVHKRILVVSNAFYSSLASKIPGWVENAQCQESINNIFRVQRQSKAYTEELTTLVSSEIKAETRLWVQNHFIPLLKSEIQNLSEAVDTQANTYLDELEHLKVSLELNQDQIIDKTTPSKTNRLLSSGAALLIGDLGGAIMGGAGGYDATLKTMGCEFGAGLILGIASLFTPIGLTAIVISVVLSAIVGGNWALSSIEENIRKEVTGEIIKGLKSDSQKEQFNQMITYNINKSLSELRKSVNAQWDELLGMRVYGKAC